VPVARTISPAEPSRIDDVIGRVPIVSLMGAGHAALCLGIARAATTAVIELATKKVSVDAGPGLKDRGPAQAAVAIAQAKLAAFQSHLHALVGRQWEIVEQGNVPTTGQIADVWSVALTTGRECRAIVGEMYETAGTSALYTSSLIERCHRDIHAAGQHVVTQRGFLEDTGRVYFGLDATHPLYSI